MLLLLGDGPAAAAGAASRCCRSRSACSPPGALAASPPRARFRGSTASATGQPFGIVLVIDRLAALMLLLTNCVALPVLCTPAAAGMRTAATSTPLPVSS